MFTRSWISWSRNDPDALNACAMAYKGNVKAVALYNSKWQVIVKQIWQTITCPSADKQQQQMQLYEQIPYNYLRHSRQ